MLLSESEKKGEGIKVVEGQEGEGRGDGLREPRQRFLPAQVVSIIPALAMTNAQVILAVSGTEKCSVLW